MMKGFLLFRNNLAQIAETVVQNLLKAPDFVYKIFQAGNFK